MKFIHNINIDDFITDGITFDTNEYMGIKFTMESIVDENDIGIYLKTVLPYGYDSIDIIFRIGVLNSKKNLCNIYKWEYTFTYDLDEQVGTNKFIDKNKAKNYKNQDDIYLIFEIIKCDCQENNSKMIQKIYQKVVGYDNKTIENLNDEIDYLNKIKNELEKLNKNLSTRSNKYKIQYQFVSSNLDDLKRELILRDKHLANLNKNIEVLKLENEELKKELDYYNPDSNASVMDFINVAFEEEDDEDLDDDTEKKRLINIYHNIGDQKYMVNVLDLDKVILNNYSLYDLKVMQGKVNRLNSIIQDKILEMESCKICFTNELNCILLPCGHKCCCVECSININNKCPMCRNSVTQIQKIF